MRGEGNYTFALDFVNLDHFELVAQLNEGGNILPDIKTRDMVKGTIRTLDKGRIAASRMKQAYIQTKDRTENSVEAEESSPTEYAADRMESGTKQATEETVHQTKKGVQKGAKKVKDKVERKIEDRINKKVENKAENSVKNTAKNSAERASKNAAKKSAEKSIRATNNAGRKSIRTVEKTSAKTIKQSARSAGKQTVKAAQKGSVKTVKTTVKTAEKTSKAAIKTTKQAAKAAQKSAKAAAKAAQKAAQAARAAAKAAIKAAKAAIQLLIKIIKAIIAALQKLISAIIAGGWVSVLVIVIICLVALICWSVYGLFASAQANDGEYTMHNIITRINNEYNEKITKIKTDNPHDKLEMSESKAEWKEVLAIYAVAYNMTNTHPANPDEVQVITLDESKEEYIRNLFWEINKIDHRIEKKTVTEQVEEKQDDGSTKKVNKQVEKETLYITVSHVDLETMMTNKGFTDEQKKMCRLLLSDENNDLWRELLHGITSSNSDIVLIAQEQLGNVGGQPYWSWYGFSSRVEWCCCFVSWCANECGYIESGAIPKYSVVDTGVDWFKSRNQWLDKNEEPEPGMIIFFDWADDGLDGSGDHTGIVEKVENGTVYTIEGNSSDSVQENQYSVGNNEILGYGYYEGNNSEASGDTANQVWTYLKSYGYSDSVAAGIIGNMMRECCGDTLNLDWDIVGHYGGSEFYGLCQWCLDYTPSGFIESSVKKQCEYLKNTIKSEFATYGGNYNGITYEQFLKSDTRTAAIAFERVYERCGDYSNEDNRRANNAQTAYNRFHK